MTLYKVASLVLKLYVCRFPDEEDIHEDSSGEYDASLPPSKRPHFEYCPRDISNYIALSSADKSDDSKKYGVIVDHFVPDAMYKFPKASNGRSFQYKWLSKYPWLTYSEKADGGFCVACVLFSHSSSFRSDPGILVNTPLTDFKRTLERVYHKTATVKMDAFIKVMNDR